MKRKILAVALGLTLCFGMTGCTKGDIEPESNILGNKYRAKKMLAKGKGGYSFLIEDNEKREYTLKCFHHQLPTQ